MRVDPNMSSLLNAAMQGTEQALNTAVQQLASGQRVTLPSDDPAASAENLQSLAESANVDRYTKNGDAVLSQAEMADAALSNVVNELNQAISLGTQGADGSMTIEDRGAIATQVQSVLSEVVSQANTTFSGAATCSAGTAAAVPAFTADRTSANGVHLPRKQRGEQCGRGGRSAGQRKYSRRPSFYKPEWERVGVTFTTDLRSWLRNDYRYRQRCHSRKKRAHQRHSTARPLRRRCESDQCPGELSFTGDYNPDIATAGAYRRGHECSRL